MRYRYLGKVARIDIDTYPYPLISLKAARVTCEKYRTELEQGNDLRTVVFEETLSKQNIIINVFFGQWFESQFENNRSKIKR